MFRLAILTLNIFSSHALHVYIQFDNSQDINILNIEMHFFGSNIWLLYTKSDSEVLWFLLPLLAVTLVSTITHELCLFCRRNHP